MGNTPDYKGWKTVPRNLLTKTQLADLDLPRVPAPGQEPAATLGTYDYRRRLTTHDLYDVADTALSPADAVRLAGARLPAAETRRLCVDCGARTERPAPLRRDHARRLCDACAHIADLIAEQARLRASRARHAAWAAELVADPAVRYAHVSRVVNRWREELAARVSVADHDGRLLVDVAVSRFVGTRKKGVPADAVRPEEAAGAFREAVAGRRLVCWSDLLTRSAALMVKVPVDVVGGDLPVPSRVKAWRGDVDPVTGEAREPVDPGRADRLWLLVARMAATPVPDAAAFSGVGARLQADERAAHLYLITHHPEAAERVEALMRMLDVAAGPATVTRGAASRRVPGATEMHLPIHLDGMPGHDGE